MLRQVKSSTYLKISPTTLQKENYHRLLTLTNKLGFHANRRCSKVALIIT